MHKSPTSYLTTGKRQQERNRTKLSMALGRTASKEDIVELPLSLQGETRKGHSTVKRMKNNMYSINKHVKEGCIPIFEYVGFKVYDTTNTRISVALDAVPRGWFCPNNGL